MQFGLDVRIDGEYGDPRILAALAVEAERAGWDGFFVQDAMVADKPLADPWIALAAIAARTERLRIGTFMTALPRRRPWKVARETVSLDLLSHGRLIFGAGSGFQPEDFSAFGEETDLKVRAEKLDEGLEILAGLWTGKPCSYQGKHYQVHTLRALPRPLQEPRIPVWIGGQWPHRRPFQRAARWDGIYVMTLKADGDRLTPQEVRDMLAFIKKHRGSLESFDVAYADNALGDPERGVGTMRSYREAGVTWWLEGIWGGLQEMQERIRRGPPGI